MKTFDSRTYSVNDFREWNERQQLELQPRFQRRSVWTDKARSFLMDTIVRGKPIPKVFIRQKTNPTTRETIREVVDGQQRLRTILRFLDDGFTIAKIHNPALGGLTFSQLDEEVQRLILDYEVSVDVLLGAADQDVLDIFARINSYAVTLNSQEKLNAAYFGEFKQAVYDLSFEYTSFWSTLPFLSAQKLLRMAEAELVSDLLIAMSDGIRSKKAINRAYKQYDDHFPNMDLIEERFRNVLDMTAELMHDHYNSNYMRRVHLFYTLYTAVYHMQYGLSNVGIDRQPIKKSNFGRVLTALENIDVIFSKSEELLSSEERQFLTDSRRATTDEAVRIRRTVFTCRRIVAALEGDVA